MGNIGSGEVLVILVLGLLVLGPERLPEFARKIGNFINNPSFCRYLMLKFEI